MKKEHFSFISTEKVIFLKEVSVISFSKSIIALLETLHMVKAFQLPPLTFKGEANGFWNVIILKLL